jgi:hypothetical protein
MPAVGLRGLYGADYLPLLAALGIFPVFARVPRMTIVLVFIFLSFLCMCVRLDSHFKSRLFRYFSAYHWPSARSLPSSDCCL